MQNPFFSVILPTYNRANMIGRAIESVIAQTYASWELLVVDDGSTDNTKEVVEEYNDSRIRYIYQQNAERSAARNNGIDNAKGEYVCFIDSDDYYLDTRLKDLFEVIESHNFSINFFFTDLLFLFEDGSVSKRTEYVPEYNNIQKYLLYHPVGSPQVCIKKELLLKKKYNTELNIAEDLELWVRLSKITDIIYIKGIYSSVAIEHNNRSVNDNSSQKGIKGMFKSINIISSHSGSIIPKSAILEIKSNLFYKSAILSFKNGKKLSAKYFLLVSILTWPFHKQFKHRLYSIINIKALI